MRSFRLTNIWLSVRIIHALKLNTESYFRTLEKYSSGWRGAPAKGIDRLRGARVQIPPSPFSYFCFKNKSWHQIKDVIIYIGCRKDKWTMQIKKLKTFLKKVVDKKMRLWYSKQAVARQYTDENLDNWTVKHIYNPRKFFERDSLERQAHSKNDRKIL